MKICVVFALVICLVLSGCSHRIEAAGDREEAKKPTATAGTVVLRPDSPKLQKLQIEVSRLTDVPVEEVVASGSLEVNSNLVSHVSLPLPGRVKAVMVQLGDSVKEGQLVLKVESPDADTAESDYLRAEASVTQAKSALLKARAEFERASDLFEHNAVAKKEMLSAENQQAQAKAALDQAEAGREQAARKLALLGLKPGEFGQQVVVRAPIGGKVLAINVATGEYRNDTSAPLLTLADLSTLWITSNVPESQIRFCHVGGSVQIELIAFPGEVFRGRVASIADTVDPQLRTIKVRADLNNASGRFRPDMFGKVRYSEIRKPLILVPEGSVFQQDGQSFLFVEEAPGRFVERKVELGQRTGDKLVVQSGLKPGERVVAAGAIYLKESL